MNNTLCSWCGATVPAIEGPAHPYVAAAPGCWAKYGEVLAREYSDPRYFAAHRLTVDTYSAQHPGRPSRRAVQSVCVHLMCLYLVLEIRLAPTHVTGLIKDLVNGGVDYHWLEPPDLASAINVTHVLENASPDEHRSAVIEWANSVWTIWALHHATVRGWADSILERKSGGL